MWFVVLPGILFGMLGVLGPLRLSELGLGALGIGATWLVATAFEAIASPYVGRVSDRRGRIAPILVGLVASAIALSLLPWPDRWFVLAVLVLCAAVSFGLFWAPAMSLLADSSEARGLDYAYGFALMNMAWAPGQFTGAVLGGALAGATGSDAVPYLCAGVVCVLTLAVPAPSPLAALPESGMTIRKLLVANRGEIAARIFRTCRELGIGTVAVVAPDDRGSLHGRTADETVEIASYLYSEEHIRAARQTGADAIHPGYGFLAENADFAEATGAAGLVFVGPTPEALRAGGDKLAAKRIAREAGVPVVESGDPEALGFPLIIKAAAGGGGRGMRIVRGRAELAEALEAAEREAQAAFGDGTVFCERYVERPRHVEIQLLGDTQGTVVALGERECSVQRRHQKVLEESPSPALDPALRAAMSEAAVAFARAIGYTSAGTAEFMLDGRDFFFLELNGRIQVEHPVTELVTGVDLVREQIRIAEGRPLDLRPEPRGPCRRGAPVRRGSPDVPAAGGAGRAVAAAGRDPGRRGSRGGRRGGRRVRPDDREADRIRARRAPRRSTGSPPRWTRPRSPASRRISRSCAGSCATRRCEAGRTTTAFLTDYPPLSAPPVALPEGPWRGAFRLNLPAPAPAAAAGRGRGRPRHGPGAEQSSLAAPMPGTVVKVLVAEGDAVEPRQPLVVLEAMKMETPIVSPYEAVVRAVHVAEGDRVAGGTVLVELEE